MRELSEIELVEISGGSLTMTQTRCIGLSGLGGAVLGGTFGAFGGPGAAFIGAGVGLTAGLIMGGFFCPSSSPAS